MIVVLITLIMSSKLQRRSIAIKRLLNWGWIKGVNQLDCITDLLTSSSNIRDLLIAPLQEYSWIASFQEQFCMTLCQPFFWPQVLITWWASWALHLTPIWHGLEVSQLSSWIRQIYQFRASSNHSKGLYNCYKGPRTVCSVLGCGEKFSPPVKINLVWPWVSKCVWQDVFEYFPLLEEKGRGLSTVGKWPDSPPTDVLRVKEN